MRILMVGPFPDPVNGVSFANLTLRENLIQQGYLVSTVDTSTKTLSSTQGKQFSFRKAVTFLHIYTKVFHVFSSQVIYTTPGQTFFGIVKYAPFYLLARLSGKPYVIHVHGNYLGKHYLGLTGIKKSIFKYLVSGSTAGIALSPSLQKNFEGLLPSGKVFVVENFVAKDLLIGPYPEKYADKIRLIYLSNLMQEKGILEVLAALLELKRKGVPFSATIAGAVEQGLEEEILVKKRQLLPEVEFLPTIGGEEKKQKLLEANVFILPTWYIMEGQPISLLEGMATGNIIITTAHAGIPDIIGPDNGYFVEEKSASAISDLLMAIHRDLPAEIEKFSNFNRMYAGNNFTEEKFVKKIRTVFKELQPSKKLRSFHAGQ